MARICRTYLRRTFTNSFVTRPVTSCRSKRVRRRCLLEFSLNPLSVTAETSSFPTSRTPGARVARADGKRDLVVEIVMSSEYRVYVHRYLLASFDSFASIPAQIMFATTGDVGAPCGNPLSPA